jgi:hypothetical protein
MMKYAASAVTWRRYELKGSGFCDCSLETIEIRMFEITEKKQVKVVHVDKV